MTLGTLAAVVSCSDPFETAICRPRTLSSRRKSPAHRIEISLLLFAQAEHLPQSRLQQRLRRALAASVQPVLKILNFDNMRNLWIPDLNADSRQSSSDVADPVVTAHRDEGLGNRFVERFRRHVERMRGVVQIADDDGAGFEGHDGNLSYSLFVRLL